MAYSIFWNAENASYLEHNMDRANPETKVSSIVLMAPFLITQMKSYYFFDLIWGIPILKYLFYYEKLWNYFTAILVLIYIYIYNI